MIIAVDFDATLTMNHDFPEIGKPRLWLIEKLKLMRKNGNRLILWTCREDVYEGQRAAFPPRLYLTEAVQWCRNYGLEFDAVNKQVYESKDPNFKVSRKIFADIYIDDKSAVFNDTNKEVLIVQNMMGTTESVLI